MTSKDAQVRELRENYFEGIRSWFIYFLCSEIVVKQVPLLFVNCKKYMYLLHTISSQQQEYCITSFASVNCDLEQMKFFEADRF